MFLVRHTYVLILALITTTTQNISVHMEKGEPMNNEILEVLNEISDGLGVIIYLVIFILSAVLTDIMRRVWKEKW